jgi:hypothetical protein
MVVPSSPVAAFARCSCWQDWQAPEARGQACSGWSKADACCAPAAAACSNQKIQNSRGLQVQDSSLLLCSCSCWLDAVGLKGAPAPAAAAAHAYICSCCGWGPVLLAVTAASRLSALAGCWHPGPVPALRPASIHKRAYGIQLAHVYCHTHTLSLPPPPHHQDPPHVLCWLCSSCCCCCC